MKRVLSLFLCTVLFLLPLSACSAPEQPMGAPKLTVTYLSVGKADCILLESDGHCALIDTGKNKTGEEILSLLAEKGVEKLDFILLTHLDKDHIGGADTVLSGISVDAVYAPHYVKDNKQYDQYISALEENNHTPIEPQENLSFSFGTATVTLFPAAQDSYAESNDYSIFAEVQVDSVSFLFTGDAEDIRLTEYLSATPSPCTVLKVPHHGQKCDASKLFLSTVCPKVAVITDSEKDPADSEILSFLQSLKTTTYETVNGTVTVTTDGLQLSVQQES